MAIAVTSLLAAPVAHAESEAIEGKAVVQLARGWSAFYNNQPVAAAKAVGQVTRSPQSSARLHALHIKARSLWLIGDQGSRREARTVWEQIAKTDYARQNRFVVARIKIARALHLADRGKQHQAIDLLEDITKQQLPSTVSVEAAIELALLYADARRPANATAQLDLADATLEYGESIGIPRDLRRAFLRGVSQARASIENPGLSLFEQARGMQRERQYNRAVTLFNQVIQDFPESDYAHRSQLEIGSCYLGMGRQDRALARWRHFISTAPAGPWRGQAFIRLIDTQMSQRLDLDQADKYAQQAKAAILVAMADEQSVSSWKDAAYDLYLRIGIANFCRNRGDAAAEAFQQAKAVLPEKSRLDALINAALSSRGVIPGSVQSSVPEDTVRSHNDLGVNDVALALSLGVIHYIAGEHDLANGYFERVLGTPATMASGGVPARPAIRGLPGATPPQLAFASFGKGVVLQARQDSSGAKDAFLASIQLYRGGAWHDETYYRIAMILEDYAERQFTRGLRRVSEQAENQPQSGELASAERKARQRLLASRLQTRFQAFPYLRRLIDRYPDSPRREEAFYRAGAILYQQAEAVSAGTTSGRVIVNKAHRAAQIKHAWDDAADMLNKLTESYPKSTYAGNAYVKQIDIALERRFDLQRAQVLGAQAAEWALSRNRPVASSVSLPLWAGAAGSISNVRLASTRQECLLRAGLTAYLAGQYDQAVEYINLAGPEAPRGGFTASPDLNAVGLYYLLRAIRSKKPVTDIRVLEAAQNDQQRMALQLGDLYLETVRPDRAESVFLRIIENEAALEIVPVALEAYAMVRIAVALDRQVGRRGEALEWLARLVKRDDLGGTHWHGTGMFRLALFTYNQKQDPRLSMPLYEQMLRRYPDHEYAELALAYYCIEAILIKDYKAANRSGQAFLSRYPRSRLRPVIEERLRTLIRD
ncbi:MAG: tetratricopeptide repeat protein [Verrucomicrobiota bacterium]